jgi:LEA14-like dessication related protein
MKSLPSALLLAPLLLSGCGGDFGAYLPTVKFNRLDLKDIDFEQIGVDFVFDVDNPDPVGIPLDRFAYSLGFEGVDFLDGEDPDGLTLAADGTSEMALPLTLNFDSIFEVAEATRGLDYVDFNLAGNFGFDSDIGPVDIAYDEDGSFPALRAPHIELGDLLVESADETAVNFGLNLNVDNDQGSNMDFSDLDFSLKFAGVHVGDGQLADVGTVPGASTSTITIPFAVDYEDAIDALSAAASGEKLKVDLNAGVNVATPFGQVPLTIDENGNVSVQE